LGSVLFETEFSKLTMSTFKFSCPDCIVHIETDASSVGRVIECPKCSEELVIPAYHPNMVSMPVAAHSKHAQTHHIFHNKQDSTGDPNKINSPLPVESESSDESVSKIPAHEALKSHVGALSADIKLEVVRWAFRRIEHPASWMRQVKQGARYLYAGIRKGKEIDPVAYDHPEADRFTLLGAVLLELKIQNVSMSADGREEFLDNEIIEKCRMVIEENGNDLEPNKDPLGKLDHRQCLAVLRLLEEFYLKECEHLDDMMESARLPGVTMNDLVQRAEQGTIVTSNEVLSVLYHETHVLNRRVEALEKLIKTKFS
jgi:hypothetical protein